MWFEVNDTSKWVPYEHFFQIFNSYSATGISITALWQIFAQKTRCFNEPTGYILSLILQCNIPVYNSVIIFTGFLIKPISLFIYHMTDRISLSGTSICYQNVSKCEIILFKFQRK